MKRYFLGLSYIVLVFCGVMSCGRGAKNATAPNEIAAENESGQQAATPRVFVPQLAPAMMPQEEKIVYMAEHYWDKFDFADTVFINEIDSTRMLTAMAVYARGYVPDSLVQRSMSRLMQKASTSKRMFEYFLMLECYTILTLRCVMMSVIFPCWRRLLHRHCLMSMRRCLMSTT